MHLSNPPRPRALLCAAKGLALGVILVGLTLPGCSRAPQAPAAGGGMTPEAHQALKQAHDWSDPAAFADAQRGFIAKPAGQLKSADGQLVWDFDSFDFLKGDGA